MSRFDEVQRMFMDEGGPDEFFSHEADAVAREGRVFLRQIGIAQVHEDGGAGGREVFRRYSRSACRCLRLRFSIMSSTMPS